MMGDEDDKADQLATPTPNENPDADVDALLNDVNSASAGGIPPVDDPWATPQMDHADAAAANSDDLQGPTTTENENNPLHRLRESSARFGQSLLTSASNLDNRFHVSDHAKNIDVKYNVSESVSNSTKSIATALGSLKLTERVTSLTSKVSEDAPNFDQIASKTKGIISALDDAVARPVSIKVREEVAPAVSQKCEDWGVNDSLRVVGHKVRDFDERVGVTKTAVEVGHGTVDVLADGLDKISQSLVEGNKEEIEAAAVAQAAVAGHDLSMEEQQRQLEEQQEKDKDGFPTSFTKEQEEDDDI